MRFYVMRHGPAEDGSASGSDFDRRLTASGRDVVRRVAMALRDLREGMGPLRVLASPLIRAQETAAIVASLVGDDRHEVETRHELGIDAPPAIELVAELAAADKDATIVGHQPSVEMLVRALCQRGVPQLEAGFRTATVVCLINRSSEWVVDQVLAPGR